MSIRRSFGRVYKAVKDGGRLQGKGVKKRVVGKAGWPIMQYKVSFTDIL